MQYANDVIEELLQRFKPAIGRDYEKYKNHVYRVFLNCLLLDGNKYNEDKYAVAAALHDIGIWTNHTIDYLPPSIKQAEIYLAESGKQLLITEISLMIYWHHKTGAYKGSHETTVETFRRADWADVSLNILTFGIKRRYLKLYRGIFPRKGFHFFLVKKVTKNFFRHPLNPLPMFKR